MVEGLLETPQGLDWSVFAPFLEYDVDVSPDRLLSDLESLGHFSKFRGMQKHVSDLIASLNHRQVRVAFPSHQARSQIPNLALPLH